MSDFQKELKEKAVLAEQVVLSYLPVAEGPQKVLLEAMQYSVAAGGKRLRPLMMREVFTMFGGEGDIVEPFMAALEMIHNYSLVHDDLPAMDNDFLRRGKPTTHAVYGDGMAVLAGDGLLNLAFETAAKAFDMAEGEQLRRVCRAYKVLAKKAGYLGMIGGQSLDVYMEKQHLSPNREELIFIHETKTAALLQASLLIGAILGGADDEQISQLEEAGRCIGLAFQIRDDVLDVISTEEVLGKPIGSDKKNEKVTYVTLFGMEKAQEHVDLYSKQALAVFETLPVRSAFMESLVKYLTDRNY